MSTQSGRPPEVALAEYNATLLSKIPLALDNVAAVYRYNLSQKLSQPGSGRLYKVRKGKGYIGKKVALQGPVMSGRRALGKVGSRLNATKFHQASAPGEPPAPELNELKRSIYVQKEGIFRRIVGVAKAYAAWLEFGTPRMAPRPYLRNTMEESLKAMNIAFRTALTTNKDVKS